MILNSLYSTYSANGIARLSLCWENPNIAGAALATLMPLFWGLRAPESNAWSTRLVYTAWFLECALTVLVVMTYSRGALVAVIVAGGFYAASEGQQEGSWRRAAAPFALRAAVLMGSLLALSSWQRVYSIVEGDRSVLNRLVIWRHGLRMFAQEPLTGWGEGYAGISYIHWFQPVSSAGHPANMINSYINVAVERGAPAFFAVLFSLCLPVFLLADWRPTSEKMLVRVRRSCATCVVAFAVAIFFNAIDSKTVLFGVAAIAMIGIITSVKSTDIRQWIAASSRAATISLSLVALSFCAGYFDSQGDSDWRARCVAPGVTLVGKDAADVHWILAPDFLTLGADFGRALRSAMPAVKNKPMPFIVVDPRATLLINRDATTIAFGARAADVLEGNSAMGNVVLVYPSVPPTQQVVARIRAVLLPEYDDFGYAEDWIEWATKHSCRIIRVKGGGPSIGGQLARMLEICFGLDLLPNEVGN